MRQRREGLSLLLLSLLLLLLFSVLLLLVMALRPCRHARRIATSNARASFGGGARGGATSLIIFFAAARVIAYPNVHRGNTDSWTRRVRSGMPRLAMNVAVRG